MESDVVRVHNEIRLTKKTTVQEILDAREAGTESLLMTLRS